MIDERPRRRRSDQRRNVLCDLVAGQALQVDVMGSGEPAQLGQSASLRRVNADLVGAVGTDEHHVLVD